MGVSHTSGDVHPLLQAAEQFLTDHYCMEAAVTAQWHIEGAGSWIKSYTSRLSHIQGYLPSTKAKATTHTASVAAWRLPTAQEPHLTGKSNTTRGLMATTRAQRRQREVEYDNTAVPTAVQIGVTDVQDMTQALNPTVAKEDSVMEEDPDAPGGKTYEIVAKLMRDQGNPGRPY